MDASEEFSVYKNPYSNCCQMSFSLSEYTKHNVGWGFALETQTQLREFTMLPRFLAGQMECRGGEGRTTEVTEGEGAGTVKGKENNALVVRGVDTLCIFVPFCSMQIHISMRS